MAKTSSIFLHLALADILMLTISLLASTEAAPTLDSQDPNTNRRLREMFEKSQAQAVNDFYEQQALKMMTNQHTNAADSRREVKLIPISLLDLQAKVNGSNVGEQQQALNYLVVKHDDGDQSADVSEDQVAIKSGAHHEHDHDSKSDARQSSLFSGLTSPNGFGNAFGSTNPLMGSFLRAPALPTLPPFPTLASFTPRPTRPAKKLDHWQQWRNGSDQRQRRGG